MFPAWPASGPEPNASRPPAHSFSAPTGQKLPFTFSSRSGQPVNRQMLFFAASVFKTRKHEVHIFSASKAIVSGLAGQHLPPPFFSYRPTQSSTNQLPSFRLGRPTPYIPPHHFSKIHQSPSSPPSSRFSPFRTSNSNLIPPLSQRPPLLPSCCRFQLAGQTRNVVSRVGAACKAAGSHDVRWTSALRRPERSGDRARSPRFFFFLYVSFFFCFSLSPLLFHLPGAAASPRRLHFSFCFCFSFYFFFLFFCFYFCFFLFAFFLFIFILIFYSCFFFVLSFCFFFLFTFALIFVFLYFIFAFAFIFIFAFLLSFYLCFFVFLFYLCFSFSFLSFFLFYFFALLSYSTAIFHPTFRHSLFSPPPPIFPIPSIHFPAAAKRKKISAKESTGVEWPPGSERAAGGKTEGRD